MDASQIVIMVSLAKDSGVELRIKLRRLSSRHRSALYKAVKGWKTRHTGTEPLTLFEIEQKRTELKKARQEAYLEEKAAILTEWLKSITPFDSSDFRKSWSHCSFQPSRSLWTLNFATQHKGVDYGCNRGSVGES